MSSADSPDRRSLKGEACPKTAGAEGGGYAAHVDVVDTAGEVSAGVILDSSITRSAWDGPVGGAYDETDDISDILSVRLLDDPGVSPAAGGSTTLSASGQLSVLSASAVEFTPGGQPQGPLADPSSSPPPGTAGQDGDASIEGEYNKWGYSTAWVGEDSKKKEMENDYSSGRDQDRNPYYAQVQLEAEVLDLLAESFSDCSLESLQVALAKGDWNLDRASAAVLAALEATAYESSSSLGAKIKPPCRHLLLGGECRRSDCAFSHDFAATTCRYWLRGQCANPAEACLFLHDLEVPDNGDEIGVGGLTSENDDAIGDGSAPLSYRDGNGSGNADGNVLEMDQFPSLESKKALHPSEENAPPTRLAYPAGGSGGTTTPHAGDAAFKAVFAGTGGLHEVSSSLVHPNQQPFQGPQRTGATTTAQHGQGPQEGGAEKGEDALLAAVVAATSEGRGGKGGKAGGRKGGRGRKTRFTAVSLQTLLNPTSGSPPAVVGRTATTAGHPSNELQNPTSSSEVVVDGTARGSGGPTPTTARTTKSGVSFASVVGSSPPILPAPSSLQPSLPTAEPAPNRVGRGGTAAAGVGVPNVSQKAWGGGRGETSLTSWAIGSVRTTNSPGGGGGSAESPVVRNEWVSTGDAVALQYQQARKEAGELARARNKLFTLATEAFRRGEGMIARDLARRGRELNSQMKEKHRQAAADIFASRNPGDQVFERQTLDLHGLHVSEAIETLDREMAALSHRGVCRVKVLTGTGHHSKGPNNKARLSPAVEYFCQARSLPLRELPDQSTSHVGAVEIDFKGLLQL